MDATIYRCLNPKCGHTQNSNPSGMCPACSRQEWGWAMEPVAATEQRPPPSEAQLARSTLETWCGPLGLPTGMPLHDLAFAVAQHLQVAANKHAEELAKARYENRHLRFALALNYSGVALYRDDGECADNSVLPFIDWKRDTWDELAAKMKARGMAALEKDTADELDPPQQAVAGPRRDDDRMEADPIPRTQAQEAQYQKDLHQFTHAALIGLLANREYNGLGDDTVADDAVDQAKAVIRRLELEVEGKKYFTR